MASQPPSSLPLAYTYLRKRGTGNANRLTTTKQAAPKASAGRQCRGLTRCLPDKTQLQPSATHGTVFWPVAAFSSSCSAPPDGICGAAATASYYSLVSHACACLRDNKPAALK